MLSLIVFVLAFRFLVQHQYDHLLDSLQLIGNTLKEELEEEQPEDDDEAHDNNPDLLENLNTDSNLAIFLYNPEGSLISRALSFPLPDHLLQQGKKTPELIFYDQTMLLRASNTLSAHGAIYGNLILVYRMSSETSFLKLLGFLLLGANLLGVIIALIASLAASRRMLAPIGQMISAANRVDSATLDAKLEVPEADDELRSLALTLNSMLTRVSNAYHQQGRFVADVSHELRTPLAIMQGNVDLLSRWGTEDKTVLQDSISALSKQTAYMSGLVENLLFLARSDNAQFSLSKTPFSVNALYAELIEEQSLIDNAHVYRSSISPEDAILVADRDKIKQMLQALIDNSAKYTPVDGTITLGFTREDKAGRLFVRDDGCGMEKEECEHIFERFYRVDQARAKATGGMGLGLSIVLAIAQAHGGSAHAESTPGKGATVTVVLPQ
ncbi:MAG: ATP-binding protein [Christensenella sp.]|nr:ATP-binding protein [Christensenella sp.]